MMPTLRRLRSDGAVVGAVARRPRLWLAALSTARSMVPARWWRRAPFLPVPDRQWLRFRLVTAYGGDGSEPMKVDDVITFIDWRRSFPADHG